MRVFRASVRLRRLLRWLSGSLLDGSVSGYIPNQSVKSLGQFDRCFKGATRLEINVILSGYHATHRTRVALHKNELMNVYSLHKYISEMKCRFDLFAPYLSVT